MTRQIHHNSMNAKEAFLEKFDLVTESDRWAAAAWRISGGRIELVRLTTFNFPNGDMLRMVAQLANTLADQQIATVVPEPLPSALFQTPFEFPEVPSDELTELNQNAEETAVAQEGNNDQKQDIS